MASSNSINRWIVFAYLYFPFDNVFFKIKKNVEKLKNSKKRKTWPE